MSSVPYYCTESALQSGSDNLSYWSKMNCSLKSQGRKFSHYVQTVNAWTFSHVVQHPRGWYSWWFVLYWFSHDWVYFLGSGLTPSYSVDMNAWGTLKIHFILDSTCVQTCRRMSISYMHFSQLNSTQPRTLTGMPNTIRTLLRSSVTFGGRKLWFYISTAH